MSLVSVKKSVLAFILAVLLVASMLPLFDYTASAASYYSATGTVTDATMNTITILKNGRYRTFSKMDAKILKAPDGIALQDIVKIIYNANNPKSAVQIVMISHNPSPVRVPYDSHQLQTVTGAVSDAGMSTITITTPDGSKTFDKEDAHILNANDGILLGDTVRISYYDDNPDIAVQVFMVSYGSLHRAQTQPSQGIGDRFNGVVIALGDENFTCQGDDGTTRTFYFNAYDGINSPGLQIDDYVNVLASRDHPGVAQKIIIINGIY